MKILITNDDGIHSPFLHSLARAIADTHDTIVVAPSDEQSWIGRAMTRNGRIDLSEVHDLFPCPAFSLTGTPSDCVNIGLGYLCQQHPDLVLSGINIGHNAGLSFVASSGTIGAALEGALHNIPSIAASMYLTPDRFQLVDHAKRDLDPAIQTHVDQASAFLSSFLDSFLEKHNPQYGQVHSINFPNDNMAEAQFVKTRTAHTVSQPLFERIGNQFEFCYKPLETHNTHSSPTDQETVHDGNISHTIFDYANLCK